MSNIIKVKDSNGNWIGIPALQGEPGITPHIGENGNWFLGEEDTGVKANIDLTPYATTEEVNQAINAIDIPTNISDLTNDSGFITNTVDNLVNYYKKSETYTQAEVNNLINSITTLNIEVVSALPTSNISSTTIYLKGTETTGTNDYEEWIYVNDNWELIGTTAIDLTNYTTKEYVDNAIANVTTEGFIFLEASTDNIIDFNALTEPGYYLIKNCSDGGGTTLNSGAGTSTTSIAYYDVMLRVGEYISAANVTSVYQFRNFAGSVFNHYRSFNKSTAEWTSWALIKTPAGYVSAGTFASGMKCDTPTEDTHLANKAYVDAAIAEALSNVSVSSSSKSGLETYFGW